MELRKRGRVWQAIYYDARGVRIFRSTHCTDRKAAEAAARRYEREAQDPRGTAENAATLSDALTLLLEDREALVAAGKRARGTVEMYRQKAGHLRRLFELDEHGQDRPFRLASLNAHLVDKYIATRRSEGAAENTIAKELVALRSALRQAKRAELWRGDLGEVMPVAFAPEYRPRDRALRVHEMRALLAHLTRDHAARAAYQVATSANWSESARARRDDATPDGVRVHGTKRTSRRRVVPLATTWQRELHTYALEHGEGQGDALFASSYRGYHDALRRACDALTAPLVTSNDLRRTFAQWMRASGVPLELIAPAMGHGSTQMLERVYGRLPPDVLASRIAEVVTGTVVAQTKAKRVDLADDTDEAGKHKSLKSGAEGGTRTRTPCRVEDFKSSSLHLPEPRNYKRSRFYARGTGTVVAQHKAPRRRRGAR